MKILLIRNDNIGDLACTTPLLEVLSQAYPEATFDFLGNSYNIDLLREDPRLSHLWSYEKAKHLHGFFPKIKAWIDKVVVLTQLRFQRYDAIIIAVPVFNKRTTSIASWIKPKAIYGAPGGTHKTPKNYHSVSIDLEAPHVLQVLTYASALGINMPPPESMSLFLSPQEKERALLEKSLTLATAQHPIIALQISARRPKQRWSLEQWKEFIALLLPHAHLRLLWSPGSSDHLQHPGDDLLASQLVTSFPPNTLLAQPTHGLRNLMVAFSTCDLAVGSDGGAMHIAAALSIPTLTLFGDIDPTIWRPYAKNGHFLKSSTDHLKDLPPQEAAQKVLSLIH